MKSTMRVWLVVISTWSMAFLVIAVAFTVCSSCGVKAASGPASCQGR